MAAHAACETGERGRCDTFAEFAALILRRRVGLARGAGTVPIRAYGNQLGAASAPTLADKGNNHARIATLAP